MTAGFTVKNAILGDYVDYLVSGNGSGIVSHRVLVTSTTQDVAVNLSGFPTGAANFTVSLLDPANNQGNEIPLTTQLHMDKPPTFQVSLLSTTIDGSTAAADTSFSFVGAQAGTTYTYTVTSSGNNGATQAGPLSGPVTTSTQTVSGVNVSTLPSGTLTYSVKLTNSEGNSTAVTATATLLIGPAPFTVTPKLATIDNAALASAGFSLAGAEVNASYSYQVSDSAGDHTTPVTGKITSAAEVFQGINLSGLADGAITYTVTLTNSNTPNGTTETAPGLIDRVPPADIELSTSVAPAAATTGTVIGYLQAIGLQNGNSQLTERLLRSAVRDGRQRLFRDPQGRRTGGRGALGAGPYSVIVKCTDALGTAQTPGTSIEQTFKVTVGTDPIAPAVNLSGTLKVSASAPSGTVVGAFDHNRENRLPRAEAEQLHRPERCHRRGQHELPGGSGDRQPEDGGDADRRQLHDPGPQFRHVPHQRCQHHGRRERTVRL